MDVSFVVDDDDDVVVFISYICKLKVKVFPGLLEIDVVNRSGVGQHGPPARWIKPVIGHQV